MKAEDFARIARTFARQQSNTNLSVKESILLNLKHDLKFLINKDGYGKLEYDATRMLQLIKEDLEKIELEMKSERG